MSYTVKSIARSAAAAVVLLGCSAAYAGPEGRYNVTGSNPGGGGQYGGTVRVVAQGAAYKVDWRIGNSRFTGVGLLTDKNFFSVAYYGSNLTGVAVYREQPDGTWKGAWAVKGSGGLGAEDWTPR